MCSTPCSPGRLAMDAALIKREFGDRLSFYGAVDIQQTLPRGTPQEVRGPKYRNAVGWWVGAGATSALRPTTSRLTHLWRTSSPCTLRPGSFRPSDRALAKWTAIGPDGGIYVANSGNNCIRKITLP